MKAGEVARILLRHHPEITERNRMKLVSSLMKNTSIVLAGTIIRMISSFVLVLIVTRALGPKGMGEYSVILSLYWLFQKIATMGLEPIIIREVAKDPSKASFYLTDSIIIGLAAAAIMSFFMTGFGIIVNYPRVIIISSAVMSGTLILTTVNLMFQAIFIGIEKTEYGFPGIMTENLFRLGVSILILYSGYGLVSLCAVFLLSSGVRLVINFLTAKARINGLKFMYDRKEAVSIIKTMPLFAGSQVFNAFSGNITVIILSLLMGMELVGYYSVAMRLVGFVRLVLQSYKVAIQPVAARTYQNSKEELRKFTIKSIKYVFVMTLPVCFGSVVLSEKLIVFLFSAKFILSALLFRYLIWLLLIYGASMVLSVILIGSNNQKTDFFGIVINMSFRVALSFILIPLIGYWGAVIAVLSSLIAGAVYRYGFIRKHFFKIPFLRITWRTAAASAVMAIFVIFMRNLHVLINVSAAAVLYFILIFLFGVVKTGQFPVLRRLSRRRSAQ